MKEIFKAFVRAYDRRNIISIRGCASCSDFWYFMLTHLVVQMLLYMIYLTVIFIHSDELLEPLDAIGEGDWSILLIGGSVVFLAYTLFMLFSMIPAATLTVRRYHDAGLSGKIALGLFLLSACCVGYIGKTLLDVFSYYQDMFMGAGTGFAEYALPGMSLLGPFLVAELLFLVHLLILASPTGSFGTKYLSRNTQIR